MGGSQEEEVEGDVVVGVEEVVEEEKEVTLEVVGSREDLVVDVVVEGRCFISHSHVDLVVVQRLNQQ